MTACIEEILDGDFLLSSEPHKKCKGKKCLSKKHPLKTAVLAIKQTYHQKNQKSENSGKAMDKDEKRSGVKNNKNQHHKNSQRFF